MIMKIRFGQYAFFKGEEYELQKKNDLLYNLIIRSSKITKEEKSLGFKKYAESIYILEIDKDLIDFAFSVKTYCSHKGYKFQITDIISNGTIRIWYLIEAQKAFKKLSHHGFDAYKEVNEEELDEIWEEREPIEDFKLGVEPIFYIKKQDNNSTD